MSTDLRKYLVLAALAMGLIMGSSTALINLADAAESASAQSNIANRIFKDLQSRVLQIELHPRGGGGNAATGTGFVVSHDGLVLTNYHVVGNAVLEPDLYLLEYQAPGGQRGNMEVVAIDVIHDLALVRLSGARLQPLSFFKGTLAKGDRGYSLGYPLSQGLTVVEGTYNGLSENHYQPHFHMTTAINSGMSGGPTVTADGHVFGVNVARRLDGQLVSFVVPSRFGEELLRSYETAPLPASGFKTEIARQLQIQAEAISARLLSNSTGVKVLGNFRVQDMGSIGVECWSSPMREPEWRYEIDDHQCDSNSDVYINEQLMMGRVKYFNRILRSDKLGVTRFAYLQSTRFEHKIDKDVDRKHLGPYECSDRIVALKGTRARAVLCTRRYLQFPGMYDVILKLTTVDGKNEALLSKLTMLGFPWKDAMRVAQHYMESIAWVH